MRKIRNFSAGRLSVLSAFCLFFASCIAEPQTPETQEAPFEPLVVTATFGDVQDKTMVSPDDATKVLWAPQDEIVLFSGTASAKYTSTNTEYADKAEFTGNLPSVIGGGEGSSADEWPLRAIYPYDADATCQDGVYTTTLPSSQTAVAGTFADDLFITIARSKSSFLYFYNVCSGLKFTVDRDDIASIDFIANGGEAVAGTFSAVFGEDGFPAVQSVSSGASELTFAPVGVSFRKGEQYYLVTLPGVLEQGFTLHLHCSNGDQGSFRYSKSVSFNRGKFRTVSLTSNGNTFFISSGDLDIVPSSVRSYLNNASATYPSDCGQNGYTRTVVPNYVRQIGCDPVVLSGTDASAVVLSFDPLYKDVAKVKKTSNGKAELYNMIPGRRYFYKLVRGSAIVREGCFTPFGPLRMINGGGIVNVRDLGGWQAEGGRHVAYARIYRGYRLDDGNQCQSLRDSIGFQVDLDLRGRYSAAATNNNDPTNPARFPVENAGSYYAPVQQASQNVTCYLNLPVQQLMYQDGEHGVTAGLYQVAIRFIIHKLSEGRVVYFHCYGGADRTGTLAFLIEALLGVAESDLSQDYELTTFCGNRRVRSESSSEYAFKKFVTNYLHPSFTGNDMQEKVTAWAMTQDPEMPEVKPLTSDEISTLKALLLE